MGERVRIGQIVSTQGLRGDVRVYPLTDYKERFEELEYVYLEDSQEIELKIERVRYKKQLVILKFQGLDNIDDVQKLKNIYITIDKDKIRELPQDTYYIFDLIGSEIIDEDNSPVGILVDIVQNTAQDLYIIEDKSSKKKIMIPAVKEFVKEVNLKEKIIKVKLIEGMIE